MEGFLSLKQTKQKKCNTSLAIDRGLPFFITLFLSEHAVTKDLFTSWPFLPTSRDSSLGGTSPFSFLRRYHGEFLHFLDLLIMSGGSSLGGFS